MKTKKSVSTLCVTLTVYAFVIELQFSFFYPTRNPTGSIQEPVWITLDTHIHLQIYVFLLSSVNPRKNILSYAFNY